MTDPKDIDHQTKPRIVGGVKDSSDYMGDLLNRVEAMIQAKAGTITELGKYLLPEKPKTAQYVRVHEWVKQRLHSIGNGNIVMRLHQWAESKTIEIANDKKLSAAYRKAHKEVVSRRRELAAKQ